MTVEEAISKIKAILEEATETEDAVCYVTSVDAESLNLAIEALSRSEFPNSSDMISRQAAIDIAPKLIITLDGYEMHNQAVTNYCAEITQLPSAQPERRCVNCGRTVNNGGWYEDGRTRCPIEEHYALPKDGYCHLWEKRKDWEDDYVKRAEEGEK